MIKKPDFFIVGAAKSGTTSLYYYLKQHPQIWMPELKEPHFFGEYRTPDLPPLTVDEYLNLFSNAPSGSRLGEASQSYLYSPSAPSQIKAFQPQAKIIIILRHPIDRAYSQYWHHVKVRKEPRSFEDAIHCELFAEIQENSLYNHNYLSRGFYVAQVERYLNEFSEGSIKIFLFEDLKENAVEVCNQIFQLLEISLDYNLKVKNIFNKSGPAKIQFINKILYEKMAIKEVFKPIMPYGLRIKIKDMFGNANVAKVPPMKIETRRELSNLYKPEIIELQELIKRDLSHWIY